MLNHIHGVPSFIRGGVGVDVFFAISGYLITSILYIEHEHNSDISIRRFYIRRAFRILPLYIITIMAYGIASFILLRWTGDGAKLASYYRSLPYIASLNGELMPADVAGVFGQSWSLGIEEKFYIIWPLLFMCLGGRGRGAKIFAIVALGIAAALLLGDPLILRGGAGLILASVMTLLVRRDIAKYSAIFEANAGWFLAGAVFFYALIPDIDAILGRGGVGNVAVGAFSTLLIISLHFQQNNAIGKVLSATTLVFVGKLSYGIYLVHVLAINVCELFLHELLGFEPWLMVYVVALAGSIGIAYVLQVAIERPMIKLGRVLSTAPAGAEPRRNG